MTINQQLANHEKENQCYSCYSVFKSSRLLNSHICKSEDINIPAKCQTEPKNCIFCLKTFKGMRGLKIHWKTCKDKLQTQQSGSSETETLNQFPILPFTPPLTPPEILESATETSNLDNLEPSSLSFSSETTLPAIELSSITEENNSISSNMSDLTIAAHSQSGNITENHTENIIFLKQQTKLVIPNHSWENINIQLESLLNITCPMSLFEKGDPSACLSKLYETIQTIFHEKSVKSNPVKPKVKPQKSKFQEVKILTDLLNSDSVDIDMKNEIKNRLEFLEKELNNNTELINKAKSQKELESNCRKFENDPWQYGKNLFSNSNTKLNCTDDELIKHYSEILQTNCPPEPLSSTTPIGPQSPTPTEPLNLEPFCSGDIENFLKRKTKHSAPGPNGIPYSIWRNCPVTHKYLVHIFNSIMTRGEVPKEWKLGITKPIPKSENSKASETRPITMTNTDAKIFFGLMAERLDTFLSTNNLVDKRVQKGFAKGIPGCIEHSCYLKHFLMRPGTKRIFVQHSLI